MRLFRGLLWFHLVFHLHSHLLFINWISKCWWNCYFFRESFRQKYRRHYRLVFFIAGSVGQIVVSMTGGMYIVRVFALSSYFSYVIALIILSISIGFNLYGLKMSGVFQVCIGVLTFFILLITIISSLPYIEIKNINVHISMHEINPILEASLLIFWSFLAGKLLQV